MEEFGNFSLRDHFNHNIQRRSEFLDDDSLRLGHRRDTKVVDTIQGVINDDVTRMKILQRREEPQHKDHQKEQLTSTEEEDEDDEILDRSHHTFTPSKKKWSPQKDRILELVSNNRQDGKKEKKKEERERKGMKDQEREMLKAGFLQNMQNLEQTQEDLNSQLQQLELSEDLEG